MITVNNYEQADSIVSKNKSLRWDGWDIVQFKADASAEYDKRGVRYNNKWGFEKRYSPDREGWRVPDGFIR